MQFLIRISGRITCTSSVLRLTWPVEATALFVAVMVYHNFTINRALRTLRTSETIYCPKPLCLSSSHRGYTFKAGSYIYTNSPTLSRSEWHPLSLVQISGSTSTVAFYAEAVSYRGGGGGGVALPRRLLHGDICFRTFQACRFPYVTDSRLLIGL